MAARRPFWKWRRWKSIGFCLWPPSICIWNLKLKFQSKLDLCSGNHVVYRQTDGRTDRRTDKVYPVYPPSNFVGRGYNEVCLWSGYEQFHVNMVFTHLFPHTDWSHKMYSVYSSNCTPNSIWVQVHTMYNFIEFYSNNLSCYQTSSNPSEYSLGLCSCTIHDYIWFQHTKDFVFKLKVIHQSKGTNQLKKNREAISIQIQHFSYIGISRGIVELTQSYDTIQGSF